MTDIGDTVIDPGSLLIVATGGTTIANFATQEVSGSDSASTVGDGTESGTIVASGGIVNVSDGGIEVGGVVHGGGFIGVGTLLFGGVTVGDALIGSGAGSCAGSCFRRRGRLRHHGVEHRRASRFLRRHCRRYDRDRYGHRQPGQQWRPDRPFRRRGKPRHHQ